MSVWRTLVSYKTYQLLIYTLKSNYMKNDKRDVLYLVSFVGLTVYKAQPDFEARRS